MDGCGGVDLVWENGDGLYLNLDIGRAKSGHLDLCAGRKTAFEIPTTYFSRRWSLSEVGDKAGHLNHVRRGGAVGL